MLVRQFSLRQLLVLITACAGVSLIFSFAVRGHVWATALGTFVATLVVILLVQAAAFWLVWLFAVVLDWHNRRRSARIAADDAGRQSIAGGE